MAQDHSEMTPPVSPRPLSGVRVGILQTRYASEFAGLIEREGGMALLAPCLREVRVEEREQLRTQLEEVTRNGVDLCIFQTGVGTAALLDLAHELGVLEELIERVGSAVVVARGPKPLTVLLKRGLPVDRRTQEPHTTEQVMEVLATERLLGSRVAVQHYGADNRSLVRFLRQRGARVIELVSYRWALPDDTAPINRFLEDLGMGRVQVSAFTSAAQVENLFAFAAEVGVWHWLPEWLSGLTITAAIGPTTARALADHGVAVRIQPDRPKMVPFVRAIRQHFAGGASAPAPTSSPRVRDSGPS